MTLNTLKPIVLDTLNRWIVSHVNYIAVKLFLKKIIEMLACGAFSLVIVLAGESLPQSGCSLCTSVL